MSNHMTTIEQAYATWAALDRRLRHGIEPGGVLARTQSAERKAWERYQAIKEAQRH